jgi:multiple sugar transport system permease protein
MTVWGWLGFDVIVYLAALRGCPSRSAARRREQDGGRRSAMVFRWCRRPRCLIVWSTINALQVFDEIYVTTRGGPLYATTVMVYYLYSQAFEFFHAGYAAAIAEVLFAITLVFSLVQLWLGNRRVHYGS